MNAAQGRPRPALAAIAAVARNGIIGKDGGLPWKIPEDMKFFMSTTKGHAVVMGRRTFEEVKKPLPNRRNLVVSRTPGFAPAGVEVFATVDDALHAAWETDAMPFVIGGAKIYAAAMSRITRLYITEIDRDAEGDTHFPTWDRAAFREIERRRATTEPDVTFVIYERV